MLRYPNYYKCDISGAEPHVHLGRYPTFKNAWVGGYRTFIFVSNKVMLAYKQYIINK